MGGKKRAVSSRDAHDDDDAPSKRRRQRGGRNIVRKPPPRSSRQQHREGKQAAAVEPLLSDAEKLLKERCVRPAVHGQHGCMVNAAITACAVWRSGSAQMLHRVVFLEWRSSEAARL